MSFTWPSFWRHGLAAGLSVILRVGPARDFPDGCLDGSREEIQFGCPTFGMGL